MKQVIFAKWATGTGAGTNHFPLWGDNGFTELATQILCPVAGVFRNLRVTLTAAVTAASTIKFTLRINEANSAMTITFNPGDTTLTYTASDISISASDRLDWETINTGSGGGLPTLSVEFAPTTGNKSLYGSKIHNGSGTTPLYIGPLCGFSGEGATQTAVTAVIPCAGTITFLGVCLSTAPGGTTNATFSLWLNGTQQNGSGGTQDTRVIMGASRTGSTTFSLTVAAGDILFATYERTGGAGINIFGGISIAFDPTTAGQFIVPGLGRIVTVNSATRYYAGAEATTGPSGTITGQSTLTGITSITLSKFRVWFATTPGASKSYAFDFTLDESTSPISGSPTVTMNDANFPIVLDNSNTLTFTDNHLFTLRCVPTSTPATSFFSWALVGIETSALATHFPALSVAM